MATASEMSIVTATHGHVFGLRNGISGGGSRVEEWHDLNGIGWL